MSTLKTDAIEAATGTNTDLSLDGKGSGVPNLGAGFKVGGSAGVPTASIQDDAVTLAKMASGTDGVIITYDASGNPVHVGPGTDGQVLTSTGSGSPPAFEDAGGGAWSVLSSGTASSVANITFTGITTKTTKIIMTDINGTGGDYEITYSDDDGTSFESGSYYQTRKRLHVGESGAVVSATGGSNWALSATTGTPSDDTGYLEITIPAPGVTATDPLIRWDFISADSSGPTTAHHIGWGGNTTVGDIDQIKVSAASGSFRCTYCVIELN
jgi:hypothetical protein